MIKKSSRIEKQASISDRIQFFNIQKHHKGLKNITMNRNHNRNKSNKIGNPSKATKVATKGYRIEKIVDKTHLNGSEQILYRVRWPNTWEPEENIPEHIRKIDDESSEMGDSSENNTELTATSMNNILWEVYKIVDIRVQHGKTMYHVMWKDSWAWENDLNRPDLVQDFENNNSQENGKKIENGKEIWKEEERMKEKATGKRTRKRNKEDGEVERRPKKLRPNDGNNKPSLYPIEDEEIERIVDISTCKKSVVFLVQRLNGEQCLVAQEVARIKYPDAVMSFYEHLMPVIEKNLFLNQLGLQPISTPKRDNHFKSNHNFRH